MSQGVTAWVFYDGSCGLCHRAVRFAVRRDRHGSLFRFAPLGGQQFEVTLIPEQRATLPDTLVVVDADGRVHTRSGAVACILSRLGGGWALAGRALGALPRPLRDAAYDLVARHRRRLFARPAAVCPVLPPELRARFFP